MEKRPTFPDEYERWLITTHRVPSASRLESHYTAVALTAQQQLSNCPLWKELCEKLPDYDSRYILQTNGYPLISEHNPQILKKAFQSFFDKTYRKNVTENQNWPS